MATKFEAMDGSTPTSCARHAGIACAAQARTASTSTRCTGPTTTCPSRRRSGRSKRWSSAGKVREIGCSNFDGPRVAAAAEAAAAGHRGLRHPPEPAEPARPTSTGRHDRFGRAPASASSPYFPLASGMHDRQVPAGHASTRGHEALAAPRGPGRRCSTTARSARWSVSARSRPSRTTRSSSWPCPGWRACPAWPRSSPARPRPRRCVQRGCRRVEAHHRRDGRGGRPLAQ